MGVKKLWDVVRASGRRSCLEELRGKRVAIDVSIWLNAFVKVLHDRGGKEQGSAVKGIFFRCCKLLLHHIRPVFVFDGGVPALKMNTIRRRLQARQISQTNLQKTARQLFLTRLTQLATQGALNDPLWREQLSGEIESSLGITGEDLEESPAFSPLPEEEKRDSDEEEPVLPDLSVWFESSSESSDDECSSFSHTNPQLRIPEFRPSPLPPPRSDRSQRDREGQEDIQQEVTQIGDVNDIDVDAFRSLPPDLMRDIVAQTEMKRRNITSYSLGAPVAVVASPLRRSSSSTSSPLISPNQLYSASPDQISQMQVQSILQRGQVGRKLDEMRNVIRMEGWQGVRSSPGEYQIHIKADSPITPDTIFRQGEKASRQPTGEQTASDSSTKEDSAVPKKDQEEHLAIMFGSDSESVSESDVSASDNDGEHEVALESSQFGESLTPTSLSSLTQSSQRREPKAIPINLDGESSSEDEDLDMEDENDLQAALQLSLQSSTSLSPSPNSADEKVTVVSTSPAQPKVQISLQTSMSAIVASPCDADEVTVISATQTQPKVHFSLPSPTTDIVASPYDADDEVTILSTSPTQPKVIQLIEQEPLLSPFNDIDQGSYLAQPKVIQVIEVDSLGSPPNDIDPGSDSNVAFPAETQSPIPAKDSHSLAMLKPLEELSVQLEKEATFLSQKARQQTFQTGSVTSAIVEEVHTLLRMFGIPFIVSPGEAEAQCACLLEANIVDAVATEDSDVLLFGATEVFKNLFNQNEEIERYGVNAIQTDLCLSRDALIDYALLVGSDYTDGIPGIGPVLALEILAEFQTIESFAEWIRQLDTEAETSTKEMNPLHRKLLKMVRAGKLDLKESFPEQVVRNAYLHPNVHHRTEQFTWEYPDSQKIRAYMNEKVNWSEEKTNTQLGPVIRAVANFRSAERQASSLPSLSLPSLTGRRLAPRLTSQRATQAFARLVSPKANSPVEKRARSLSSEEDAPHVPTKRRKR